MVELHRYFDQFVIACVFVAGPTMNGLYHCQYLSTPTTLYDVANMHIQPVHVPASYICFAVFFNHFGL